MQRDQGFSIDIDENYDQAPATYSNFAPHSPSIMDGVELADIAAEPTLQKETGGVASDLMRPHDPASMEKGQQHLEETSFFSPPTAVAANVNPYPPASFSSFGNRGTSISLDDNVGSHFDSLSTTAMGVSIPLDDLPPPVGALPFAKSNTFSSPFASLVGLLEEQQRYSLVDPAQFVGVFFYDGANLLEPPDVTATVQVMQSEDRSRWIVFVDETTPKKNTSCRVPLDEFDANTIPFCHKSFSAYETDEAMDLARSLALQFSTHTTAFVVQYRQNGPEMQANVLQSFTLTNQIDKIATKDDEKSDQTSKRKNWMLWAIGLAVLLLIGTVITLTVIRKRQSSKRFNDAKENRPELVGTATVENQVPRVNAVPGAIPDAVAKAATPLNSPPKTNVATSATPLAGTFF